MNKYTPSYKPNIQYNFSDKSGFQTAMKKVSEAEAKRALRTIVDFMKTEVAERGQGMHYEPLFSQLIQNKDKFLMWVTLEAPFDNSMVTTDFKIDELIFD